MGPKPPKLGIYSTGILRISGLICFGWPWLLAAPAMAAEQSRAELVLEVDDVWIADGQQELEISMRLLGAADGEHVQNPQWLASVGAVQTLEHRSPTHVVGRFRVPESTGPAKVGFIATAESSLTGPKSPLVASATLSLFRPATIRLNAEPGTVVHVHLGKETLGPHAIGPSARLHVNAAIGPDHLGYSVHTKKPSGELATEWVSLPASIWPKILLGPDPHAAAIAFQGQFTFFVLAIDGSNELTCTLANAKMDGAPLNNQLVRFASSSPTPYGVPLELVCMHEGNEQARRRIPRAQPPKALVLNTVNAYQAGDGPLRVQVTAIDKYGQPTMLPNTPIDLHIRGPVAKTPSLALPAAYAVLESHAYIALQHYFHNSSQVVIEASNPELQRTAHHSVELRAGPVHTLTVELENDVVQADGKSSLQIFSTALDAFGNDADVRVLGRCTLGSLRWDVSAFTYLAPHLKRFAEDTIVLQAGGLQVEQRLRLRPASAVSFMGSAGYFASSLGGHGAHGEIGAQFGRNPLKLGTSIVMAGGRAQTNVSSASFTGTVLLQRFGWASMELHGIVEAPLHTLLTLSIVLGGGAVIIHERSRLGADASTLQPEQRDTLLAPHLAGGLILTYLTERWQPFFALRGMYVVPIPGTRSILALRLGLGVHYALGI